MDVRRFKLRLAHGHVRARVADARGERAVDLEGQAAARVLDAGAPLVAHAAAVAGRAVRALSVDAEAQVVRVALADGDDAPGLKLDGAAWAALAPLVAPPARAIITELFQRAARAPGTPLDEAFWRRTYDAGQDGWELDRVAPPLARWIAAERHGLAGLRVLVPGCGRGHEARALARAGARVVGVDLVAEVMAAQDAAARAEGFTPGQLGFRAGDLFALPRAGERFDLVVEHCCFCAVDPSLRAAYVDAMADVLVPGGHLVGLFWAHGRAGGPPFGVADAELAACFSRRFDVGATSTPVDSVAQRLGEERLVDMKRRD